MKKHMKIKNPTRILLGVVSIVPLALPCAVWAEDGLHGNVSVGAGTVRLNNDSPRFGEYSNLNGGGYLIGDFALRGQRSSLFIDAQGHDLGLDNKRIGLSAGRINGLRLTLGYEELPHKLSTNAMTPFLGVGSNDLVLPGSVTRASTTGGMTGLAASLQPVRLSTERTARQVGIDGQISDRVRGNLSFRREVKQGLIPVGGTVGVNGGSNASTILPKPIDYTTDELRAGLGFNGQRGQFQVDYFMSRFDDDISSLVWDNPFKNPGGATVPLWPGDAGNGSSRARMGMEPDNRHQRLSLNGGINLGASSRLSAVFERGTMRQNQTLLPYDYAGTGVTSGTLLPRWTADTELRTTHALVRLNMRPTMRLGINAEAKYYQTNNAMPVDLLRKVDNDSTVLKATCAGGQAATTCAEAMYTLPYDYTQRYAQLDASYYMGGAGTLRMQGKRETMERSYRAVHKTSENMYKGQYNVRLAPTATMNLSYSTAKRDGEYDDAIVYNAIHTAAYIATVASTAVRFDNHPSMRQFDIANRERQVFNVAVSVAADPATTFSAIINKRRDSYGESAFGLTDDDQSSVTFDIAHNPSRAATFYAFGTREYLFRAQNSRAYNGGGAKAAQAFDATRDWSASHSEWVDTIGVGGKMKTLEDKVLLKFDLIHTNSTADINYTAGAGIRATGATDVPNLHSQRNTLNVAGDWLLNTHLVWTLGYLHERFKTDNFFTDGFNPASTASTNLLLLTGPVQEYRANLVYTKLNYRW